MEEAKFTPGPWRWFGNTKTKYIYLATTHSGRLYVMDFVRWGMQSAQPCFQPAPGKIAMQPATDLVRYEVDYRQDIACIDHPDAYLIAAAPDLYAACELALESDDKAVKDVLRAALARARGEEAGKDGQC